MKEAGHARGAPGPVGRCPPCLPGAQAQGGAQERWLGPGPREGKGGWGGGSSQIEGPLGGPPPRAWWDPARPTCLPCPWGHGDRAVRPAPSSATGSPFSSWRGKSRRRAPVKGLPRRRGLARGLPAAGGAAGHPVSNSSAPDGGGHTYSWGLPGRPRCRDRCPWWSLRGFTPGSEAHHAQAARPPSNKARERGNVK